MTRGRDPEGHGQSEPTRAREEGRALRPTNDVGPRLPRSLVSRPRLLARLEPALPLTILRAPLGFGKTTLATQYVRTQPGRAAIYVRLSPDTGQRETFWIVLLDRLHEVDGLTPGPLHGEHPARAQVHHQLTRARRPVTLVLDEFDHVEADSVDHELLMMLRDSPNVNLIVALRGRRQFRPALFIDIDHTVLTAAELRFSESETEALLRACAVDSPSRRAPVVQAETGGWPELIRACALAMRTNSELSNAAGRHPDETITTSVAQAFLRDRILPAMRDDALVDLSLTTAILEDVPAKLAARLVGVDPETVRAALRRLVDDGLLIADDVDPAEVYRWPPAARHALYHEAERRDPERVRELRRTAAVWLLENGSAEVALQQATAAQDWPLVVRVIEAGWESLVLTARPTLLAAFAATPAEIVEASLLSRMVRGLSVGTADPTLLDDLPELPAEPADLEALGQQADALGRLRLHNAAMVTLRLRRRHTRASRHGERLTVLAEAAAIAHPAQVTPRLPGLLLQAGITHLLAGNLSPAHRALRRAYDLAPYGSTPHIARGSAGMLALVLAIRGHTERSAQWVARHVEAPHLHGWLEDRVAITGRLAEAWSALDRLDLDGAARALSEIDRDSVGSAEMMPFIGYVEALHRLHAGRPDRTLHELSRVAAATRASTDGGALSATLTETVRIDALLALGRGNQARSVIARAAAHPLLRISRARLLLLSGDPAAAIDLANDLQWMHEAPPRPAVEMLLIKAVAHHRRGQTATARATLGNAITTAAANQLLRPFTAYPRAELLDLAHDLPKTMQEFLRSPALADAVPTFPDSIRLVQLTGREHDIITRLAGEQTVHDIAVELFLSYNTVRTYLRQIYKKLDANSREHAVAQARTYGLIPPSPAGV